ncbi:sucrase ferredoxin [Speluncibacter jeojiensis]|uniref:sucrase ferredoxin n=1 Tax=Speluncibacter jeojiensis TaxID=2710754 RepID=UPI00240FD6E6|nr:sucrase ferredoxin [Rhodococcus sp. D2-41]
MTVDPTQTCSAFSAADEPLPGTAAHVTGWVLLEHPGAWGHDVLDGKALGENLSEELTVRTKRAGVRLMLIRRPGRGDTTPRRRTVFLAHSHPENSWCERLEVGDPAELLDLDLHRIRGGAPRLGQTVTDPLTLVCAHGKRDKCCAVLGRPVAAHLAGLEADVWECSHTGGHRFAPSLILLPSGYTYGRLDTAGSARAVEAARRGEVAAEGLRGRSCWTPSGQVAEMTVRERVSSRIDDLVVDESGAIPVVTHRDGRRWEVNVKSEALPPRPVSCGAKPKPVQAVRVVSVRELSPCSAPEDSL